MHILFLCQWLLWLKRVSLQRNLKANLLVPRLELIQSLVNLVDDVADLLCSLNCWLDYLVDNAAGSVLKCEPLAVGAVDLAPS